MIQIDWNAVTPEEYNVLRQAVGWKKVSEMRAKEGLDRSTVVSVAEEGVTLGMARSISDGMQSFIVDVMVLPDYQGKGIGTLVMKELLRHEKKTIDPGEEKFVTVLAIAGKETFYANLGFLTRPNVLQGAGMSMKLVPEKQYKFEKK